MKSYVFHVSLPGTGRLWRKIEIPAHYTLSHLHYAIQQAFEMHSDHLYSFFMSGKAWDQNSRYALPEGYPPWSIGEIINLDEVESVLAEAERQAIEREEEKKREEEAYIDKMLKFYPDDLPDGVRQQIIDSFFRIPEPPGDVLSTMLGSLGFKPKQTFLYLYDYGDEHRFKVRVHAIHEDADPNAEYPRTVEATGRVPTLS
ncbi:MAG: hypothetical protein AAF639_18825 [Chloroflexota bacterium]